MVEAGVQEYEIPKIKNKIICGNALTELKRFPNACIDTIITSPPYWGLRKYGESTKTIWGGDSSCKHKWTGRDFCMKCGAWFGQLGLEPDLETFIDHVSQITIELKRVLKPTGVVFWNHGDNYTDKGMQLQNYRLVQHMIDQQGWILRNVIIWHKPNFLPTGVENRFANAYDSVFMLVANAKAQYYFNEKTMLMSDCIPVKMNCGIDWEWRTCPKCSSKGKVREKGRVKGCYRCKNTGKVRHIFWHSLGYWFDLCSVRVPHCATTIKRIRSLESAGQIPTGKNPGDVWTIPTQPFAGAHFTTYPEKLIEPMIKSGCPQWICNKCGKARVRIKKTKYIEAGGKSLHSKSLTKEAIESMKNPGCVAMRYGRAFAQHYTVGWTDCGCGAGWKPGVVLDPFIGSGTTGVVALKLARDYIGIEMNSSFVKIAEQRIKAAMSQESKQVRRAA